MFGYVLCNKETLSKEDKTRYQNLYCGLCRTLGTKYGLLERMSLSYDMTFLALFLSALYEPTEGEKKFTCLLHPFQKKTGIQNDFIEYAADMTILMTYYKCLDDWNDEKKVVSKKCAEHLKKYYQNIQVKYPRQCEAVATHLQELSAIEKDGQAKPDEAVNCFGKILAEIFVYKEDFWSNSLRRFGYELGRFVYLMDASMDYEKDLKSGNYNPLVKLQKKPEEMRDFMTILIGKATEQFEKMPIVQDEELIRNVLYGGVWQHYYAMLQRKEKK